MLQWKRKRWKSLRSMLQRKLKTIYVYTYELHKLELSKAKTINKTGNHGNQQLFFKQVCTFQFQLLYQSEGKRKAPAPDGSRKGMSFSSRARAWLWGDLAGGLACVCVCLCVRARPGGPWLKDRVGKISHGPRWENRSLNLDKRPSPKCSGSRDLPFRLKSWAHFLWF